MSFTVDDLVASPSSNHIGQEALDLQAFRSQMKVLLAHADQPAGASPRRNSLAQPRSPRASHSAMPSCLVCPEDQDRMDEDMVEEMLDAPASPILPPLNPTLQNQQQHHAPPSSPQLQSIQPVHFYAHHPYPHPHPHPHQPIETNLFTSTDPFYLSLTQPRFPQTPPSFFARASHSAFGMQMDGGAVLVDR